MSPPAALAIQVFLLLVLIVIGPPVDLVVTRGLKLRVGPGRKLRYYRIGIASQWICAALAFLSPGWRACFFLHPPPTALTARAAVRIVLWLILALIFLANFRPTAKALMTGSIPPNLARYLRRLSFFLPVTRDERRWFAALCVTAGICEEILFRGFLYHAIRVWPLHLGPLAALLLSSVIFGFNHAYQGLGGVVNTGIAGVLFGLIFLLTGNLALAMLLHAAIDLQVLILLARMPAEEATQ